MITRLSNVLITIAIFLFIWIAPLIFGPENIPQYGESAYEGLDSLRNY